jgi:septal ring factor EnvC (AmiA/AmiB activator)
LVEERFISSGSFLPTALISLSKASIFLLSLYTEIRIRKLRRKIEKLERVSSNKGEERMPAKKDLIEAKTDKNNLKTEIFLLEQSLSTIDRDIKVLKKKKRQNKDQDAQLV